MAPDPAVVQALGQTDLFSGLSKRALSRIADKAKVVRHAEGRTITEQGEGGVGWHLITEGTASVEVRGTALGVLGRGDYFGEISLIDGRPRSATVTATSPLTTLSLTSWTFMPILDDEPEVAKALLLQMCRRVRSAEERQ